jgi:hypothetical protein
MQVEVVKEVLAEVVTELAAQKVAHVDLMGKLVELLIVECISGIVMQLKGHDVARGLFLVQFHQVHQVSQPLSHSF